VTARRVSEIQNKDLAFETAYFVAKTLGFRVFPIWEPRDGRCPQDDCASPGKHPHINNYHQEASRDPSTLMKWHFDWPRCNWGIVTGGPGGLVVLDIDGPAGEEAIKKAEEIHGALPPGPEVSTGRGRHLWFRHPGAGQFIKTDSRQDLKLDLKADKGTITAPGSLHASGRRYEAETSLTVPLSEVPEWLLGLFHKAEPEPTKDTHKVSPFASPIIGNGERNVTLASFAGAMRRNRMTFEEIEPALQAINMKRCIPPLGENEVSAIARGVSRYEPGSEPLTHQGNGSRFVRLHGKNSRFIYPENWLAYNGIRWDREGLSYVERWAKDIPTDVAIEASLVPATGKKDDDDRRAALLQHAIKSQADSSHRATIRMARSEHGVVARDEEFDSDPLLFNVRNGTVDLRTGQLREHRREDLITQLCDLEFHSDRRADRWERLIREVVGGDQEQYDFLHRVFGQTLAGSMKEQKMYIIYGNGGNGKSVVLDTMRKVLGDDYAMVASNDVLMVDSRDTHPAALKRFSGKRFVSSFEVENGKRLAEALVKQFTGGEKISARAMRENPSEYRPQAKVFLACNAKPTIRGTDDGIWDRIVLIPFDVRFRGTPRQDKDLTSKLAEESVGILAWLVRGWMEYLKKGLAIPYSIQKLTDAYRSESDVFGQFLQDTCSIDPNAKVFFSALYETYTNWHVLSTQQARILERPHVTRELKARGFEADAGKDGARVYRGLTLKASTLAENFQRAVKSDLPSGKGPV
jgi:putative DNA primase/helicase